MKATGIVRRIDDLGRIVIPKEIRKTLKISEGSPLEIFTDTDGNVIFKKYSPVGQLLESAELYVQSIWENLAVPCAIMDTEKIIAVCGTGKKELKNQNISSRMRNFLSQRKVKNTAEAIKFCETSDKVTCLSAMISSQGDPIGAIVLFDCGDKLNLNQQTVLKTMATLIAYQA